MDELLQLLGILERCLHYPNTQIRMIGLPIKKTVTVSHFSLIRLNCTSLLGRAYHETVTLTLRPIPNTENKKNRYIRNGIGIGRV